MELESGQSFAPHPPQGVGELAGGAASAVCDSPLIRPDGQIRKWWQWRCAALSRLTHASGKVGWGVGVTQLSSVSTSHHLVDLQQQHCCLAVAFESAESSLAHARTHTHTTLKENKIAGRLQWKKHLDFVTQQKKKHTDTQKHTLQQSSVLFIVSATLKTFIL